jgi:hypothetical protein
MHLAIISIVLLRNSIVLGDRFQNNVSSIHFGFHIVGGFVDYAVSYPWRVNEPDTLHHEHRCNCQTLEDNGSLYTALFCVWRLR